MTRAPLDSSAAPFTQDQIEFLAEREVGLEANREKRNRQHFRRFRNAALVGFLVLAGGVGVGFHTQGQDRAAAERAQTAGREAIVLSGRAVSVDGCNRDFHTITKVRNVFKRGIAFNTQQFKVGKISADTYAQALAYYEQQLATFPLPDCRAALSIVTDDPAAPIRVPRPLHSPFVAHGNP